MRGVISSGEREIFDPSRCPPADDLIVEVLGVCLLEWSK
jgi:hypothetical protein